MDELAGLFFAGLLVGAGFGAGWILCERKARKQREGVKLGLSAGQLEQAKKSKEETATADGVPIVCENNDTEL
jgi:hypothetical protein